MKVYVIFDPLLEKVICVHEEEGMDCPACLKIEEERLGNTYYPLEEHEHEVVESKRTERNNKLKDIGI